MFVETNKDAYVTILNVDPAGRTTVLFPNAYQVANFVRANSPLQVPHPASRSRVVVTGTTGTELIKVIATSDPDPLFSTMQLRQVGAFQMLRTEPRRTARSLVVAMNRPSSRESALADVPVTSKAGLELEGAEWALCHRTIATIPVPMPAVQRMRSLQVLRTEHSARGMTCEGLTP